MVAEVVETREHNGSIVCCFIHTRLTSRNIIPQENVCFVNSVFTAEKHGCFFRLGINYAHETVRSFAKLC
jgi:hypothetical protein